MKRRRQGEIIARATAENSGGGAERGEGEEQASGHALLLSIKTHLKSIVEKNFFSEVICNSD